jgi:hypothetical protein
MDFISSGGITSICSCSNLVNRTRIVASGCANPSIYSVSECSQSRVCREEGQIVSGCPLE